MGTVKICFVENWLPILYYFAKKFIHYHFPPAILGEDPRTFAFCRTFGGKWACIIMKSWKLVHLTGSYSMFGTVCTTLPADWLSGSVSHCMLSCPFSSRYFFTLQNLFAEVLKLFHWLFDRGVSFHRLSNHVESLHRLFSHGESLHRLFSHGESLHRLFNHGESLHRLFKCVKSFNRLLNSVSFIDFLTVRLCFIDFLTV